MLVIDSQNELLLMLCRVLDNKVPSTNNFRIKNLHCNDTVFKVVLLVRFCLINIPHLNIRHSYKA